MEISLNPLDQIDPIVILATVLIFTLTFVTLRKVFVLPYVRVMERRQEMFEATDQLLTQSGEAYRNGEDEAAQQVVEARQAAEALTKEVGESIQQYRRDVVGAATAAASARLDEGRREIERERADALARLRDEALECVGLACERLLGETDTEAVASAVDGQIARRVH